MEVTFEIKVTIGYDLRNWDTKLFAFDYDCIKEDLEEFVKSEGFVDLVDYVNKNFDDDEQDIIMESTNENTCWCFNIYFDKDEQRRFEQFIVDKYQTQVEKWLLNALTHNSEKSLNDLINYEF